MTDLSCKLTPPSEFQRQLGLLKSVTSIAVIGMSPNQDRPSYDVGLYLKNQGYTVLPVHPKATSIAGIQVFPTLTAAFHQGGKIDLVDLFVAGDRTMPIVKEAMELGIKRIWFQPGAENPEAEEFARSQGMEVISGACTMAVLARAAA